MGVSLPSNGRSERDTECAPEQSANSARDVLPHPLPRPEETVVDTIHRGSDETDPTRKRGAPLAGLVPPEEAVPILQELLARAIRQREFALAEAGRIASVAVDRHWFVAGEDGYCAACGLPQRNGRHVARAA